MLVPEATTHGEVLGVVCKAKPANLESVDLFDVFRGKHVPEGQKSLRITSYNVCYTKLLREVVVQQVEFVLQARMLRPAPA